MKAALTRLVDPHRWRFRRLRRRQGRRYRADPSLAPDRSVFEALERDGVVVIPDYADAELVERVRRELEPEVRRVERGEPDVEGRFHRFTEYGVYRLLEADQRSETARRHFEDPFITGMARAFVAPDVASYQRMIELKAGDNATSIADQYHFDDWKHRFKSFLYLTDVGPEQAPYVYLKGSHHSGPWRDEKEFEYWHLGQEGPYGTYDAEEIAALRDRQGWEEAVCVGAAGTLILTDTRGIHRGTPLKQQFRLLLGNYFDVVD